MSLFDLFDIIKNLIANFGYFGIALGTFLEGVFPPIPSEVIMGFAGFLVSEGVFNPFLVLISAVLGNAASVSLIWLLGRKLGSKFIIKFGSWVGINEKEIAYGEQLFEKYGYSVVAVCQVIPLARTLIAFPAGTLKTTYWKFIAFNSMGASIWLSFLLFLGIKFGENWENIVNIIKPFEKFILIILVIVFIYAVYQLVSRFITVLAQKRANIDEKR